ncbi:hypothetical protein PLESTF_001206000, partial [Pleodorina starrii]
MTMWTTLGSALQPVLGLLDRHVPSAPTQPVKLPRRITPQPPTPRERVEEVVDRLDARKSAWTRMPCRERAQLLRRCMDSLMAVEEDLARTSTAHKGSYGSGIGEERTALLPVMFGLAEYCAAMRAGGCPQPLSLRRRTHTHPHPGDKGDKEQEGQWVATVLPSGPVGLLLPGFRGEVWMEPGQPPSQGQVYRRKAAGEGLGEREGGVALVLGAGNQVPVVALDVLHKLITDDEVVVVKTNPVNDYIGPLLRKQVQRPPSGVDGGSGRAFSPLVEAGFLEFVYGGREVGELLTHHPKISSVHLTGSADTGVGQPSAASAEARGKKRKRAIEAAREARSCDSSAAARIRKAQVSVAGVAAHGGGGGGGGGGRAAQTAGAAAIAGAVAAAAGGGARRAPRPARLDEPPRRS